MVKALIFTGLLALAACQTPAPPPPPPAAAPAVTGNSVG